MKAFILFGFLSFLKCWANFRPYDSFQLRDGDLVIGEMPQRRGLGFPKQALRRNPVEKFPRAGLVGRPACRKGFFGLRENLFLEELHMVMRRLDLLQLIAEQPEGFLLHTVQLGLRGDEVALGLFGSRGIFS
jgi:hypothetical protein